MDIIEHESIKNVVVLQTVIEELKGHNISLYERVRKVISNEEKNFFVFSNEHHKETFIERQEEESINDRNDRAIRVAVEWYKNHTQNEILFWSDDKDSREKALTMGVNSKTTLEFIEQISPELVDMISIGDYAVPQEEFKYPDHLSAESVKDTKDILKGTLNVSSFNCFEGSIYSEYNGELQSISISGRFHMNRAVHGDLVMVQILPEEQWTETEVAAKDESEGSSTKEDEEINDNQPTASEPVKMEIDGRKKRICGRVVSIVKRNWRAYCGTIDKKTVREGQGTQFVLVTPMDKRIPKIRIRTRQAAVLGGQRIVVYIDSWQNTSK